MNKTTVTKYENVGKYSQVDAIYTEPIISSDKGNIFIEALQAPAVANEDFIRTYSRELDFYIQNKAYELAKTNADKRCSLSALKQVRVALPFEKDLELAFYDSLVTSYRNRHFQTGDYLNNQKTRLIGDTGDPTNSCFALLGQSGAGKSTAIQMLTDHWPQVIRHNVGGNIVNQIVYLCVSCPNNSNFSSLYEAIGTAIDHALNEDHCFAYIRKQRTLDQKKHAVEQLIQAYNIGIIILDEIQLIDCRSTRESSLKSIMTLVNNTKVALAVVGTQDAYENLIVDECNERRIGKFIRPEKYVFGTYTDVDLEVKAKSYKYFLRTFWNYSWLNKEFKLTQDIVDAFFKCTMGLSDETVSLYIMVQDEYLRTEEAYRKKRGTDLELDGKFVNNVCKKFYPNMEDMVSRIDDQSIADKITAMLRDGEEAREALAAKERNKETEDFLTVYGRTREREQQVIEVIYSIAALASFLKLDDKDIEPTVNKVAEDTTLKTNEELTNAALKLLTENKKDPADETKETPKKKKKQRPKIDSSAAMSSIISSIPATIE